MDTTEVNKNLHDIRLEIKNVLEKDSDENLIIDILNISGDVRFKLELFKGFIVDNDNSHLSRADQIVKLKESIIYDILFKEMESKHITSLVDNLKNLVNIFNKPKDDSDGEKIKEEICFD